MHLAHLSAALLLFLGTPGGGSAEERSVYVGRIQEISRDRIELSRRGSTIIIGFFGDPKVLDGLTKFRVGDEVRAVFGAGMPPGETHDINKLLQIRRCTHDDRECTADRKAEEAQDVIDEKARAVSEEQHAQCRRSMVETLLKDPRYVPSADPHRTVSNDVLSQVNSFTGKQRVCADNIMNAHHAAVLEACELHHCGDDVGGGCAHIAGYSLSDDVIERAALVCQKK